MEQALDRLETQMVLLARRIERAARTSTTFHHMDRAAYLIARTLDENGPANVNEIARTLSLDGSTVTRQVASMEARGQATRKVHPDDARSWLISLTPSGRRAMARISALRRERYSEWVADWSSGDIDMFGALLERFNDALARSAPPPEAEQAQGRRVDHRQSVVTPRRTR